MGSLAEAEVEVIAVQFKRIGHANVVQRPASVVPLLVVCTILRPHPDIALWAAQHNVRKVLASRNHIRPLLPLDGREAAYPALHTAELIGHLPCRVERADAARG